MPEDGTAEVLWTKEPDWICPRCRYANRAIREHCRNCGFDSGLVSGDSYLGDPESEHGVMPGEIP